MISAICVGARPPIFIQLLIVVRQETCGLSIMPFFRKSLSYIQV